jgi:hypothetical protein
MNSTTSACAFEGNADFFGVGIRTGFYLQWISTLLTTLFIPAEENILRAANIILQIAVAATVLLLTARSALYAVEAVIAFWLIFGALSSLTGDGISPFGTVSGTARALLYAGVCAYGVWFWTGGVDGMLVPGGDDDGGGGAAKAGCPVVLFFNNTQLTASWPRRTGQVLSIVGLVLCAGLIAWDVVMVRLRRGRTRYREVALQTRRLQTDVALLLPSTGVIVVSIAAIEYLIRANQISALGDFFAVGQLIPFLIGLFGLVSALLTIARPKTLLAPRCWTLFGYHFT